MTKNNIDIAKLYGVTTALGKRWIVSLKFQDVGRDHNNRLLYDSKDYNKIEKYLKVSPTGRTQLRVPKKIRDMKPPNVTPKNAIRKGTCEFCKKEKKHWSRSTCGSKECITKVYKRRGLNS